MRVVVLVCDGLGVGEAPDAKLYDDCGADTLGHVLKSAPALHLPNLAKLGIGHLTSGAPGVPKPTQLLGRVGRLLEQSQGKDTTTGHWELAGLVTRKPFATFPSGFPAALLEDLIRAALLPGVLGNKAASGTEIIRELGHLSIRTGKPIVYTSADSVFQIAAHEEKFGLERLYRVCEIARKLTLPLQIGRVIARPFVGETFRDFKRTENRRDYSMAPAVNVLDVVKSKGIAVCSVGKIEDIFDHRGITEANHTGNNAQGLSATLDYLKKYSRSDAFIFSNLVDFDQLYGHRRDALGYASALDQLDRFLPQLLSALAPEDILIITSDHGCDPTFRGTDHTREYVPCLAYSPSRSGDVLGIRSSFADVGATVLSAFGIRDSGLADIGRSIYD